MNVAIIGCGLIGKKRAAALDKDDQVTVVCDIDESSAQAFARETTSHYVTNWKDAVHHNSVDAVIIATSHNMLAQISAECIKADKHFLVEKPGARNASELKPVVDEYNRNGNVLGKVGFNHRFHPAFQKAYEIMQDDPGPMMFIRGRYGHGGRIGYDKEWRARPEISGGGELLDQGMHLIDLSRWFMGDFPGVFGVTGQYFWDMPVEDNAFMTLQTENKEVAWLHVTWTEWKNLFSFEIYTKFTKLHIEGLGGSYGTEKLYHYRMKPEMGPPETIIDEYPGVDGSWKL